MLGIFTSFKVSNNILFSFPFLTMETTDNILFKLHNELFIFMHFFIRCQLLVDYNISRESRQSSWNGCLPVPDRNPVYVQLHTDCVGSSEPSGKKKKRKCDNCEQRKSLYLFQKRISFIRYIFIIGGFAKSH